MSWVNSPRASPSPAARDLRAAGLTPMDPADGLLDHPYDVYRRLRDTAPVHRIAGPDGTPAWIVTRYDDVRAALADPRLSLDKRYATAGTYKGSRCHPPSTPTCSTWIRRTTPGSVGWSGGPSPRVGSSSCAGRSGAPQTGSSTSSVSMGPPISSPPTPRPSRSRSSVTCSAFRTSTGWTSGCGPTPSSRRTRRPDPQRPRRRSWRCSASSRGSSRTSAGNPPATCSPI